MQSCFTPSALVSLVARELNGFPLPPRYAAVWKLRQERKVCSQFVNELWEMDEADLAEIVGLREVKKEDAHELWDAVEDVSRFLELYELAPYVCLLLLSLRPPLNRLPKPLFRHYFSRYFSLALVRATPVPIDFSPAIYAVLKQVHPDCGVSKQAMAVCNSLINDTFECLVKKAIEASLASQDQGTLTAVHVQTATRALFVGELAKHAVSEGNKACMGYERVPHCNDADIHPTLFSNVYGEFMQNLIATGAVFAPARAEQPQPLAQDPDADDEEYRVEGGLLL